MSTTPTPVDQAHGQLPRYLSHKTVRAALIVASDVENQTLTVEIYPSEPGNSTIREIKPYTPGYFTKHDPQVGGYYVLYPDGYESWSPAAAFEDGYSLVE